MGSEAIMSTFPSGLEFDQFPHLKRGVIIDLVLIFEYPYDVQVDRPHHSRAGETLFEVQSITTNVTFHGMSGTPSPSVSIGDSLMSSPLES